MVSLCLPSDALLQHLPSYLGFSYLGRGVSLHGCSSKAQLLLLTLNKGYLLTAAVPDLQRGIAPLCPLVPVQPPLLRLLLPASSPDLGCGWLLPAASPGLWLRVAPKGHPPWPRVRGGCSRPPRPRMWGVSSRPPLASDAGLCVSNSHSKRRIEFKS